MKIFSALQIQLLDHLSDANCHSGNAMGEKLGVSRTTIWKKISQLIESGVPINRIPKRGYQLNQPLELIKESVLREHLSPTLKKKPVNFHLFAELDSTNRFLKELAHSQAINVCCAEKQTAGRGRFGRNWLSPFGENIYLSSRWELNCCLSKLSGLSLVVSLAILDTLKKHSLHQSIQIKWPNDLLWKTKKLAGILIEVIAETNGSAQVIIGIGLNVNTNTAKAPKLDKPWCSLYDISGNYLNRNVLIADLLNSLAEYLDRFLQGGFPLFQQEWEKSDYLIEQSVIVSQPHGSISGIAKGVTENGELCLLAEDGKIHHLSSGDTSLKCMREFAPS